MDLKEKFKAIKPYLNEHTRRIWAANEAQAIEKDGPEIVAAATGMALSTVYVGLKELKTSSQSIEDTDSVHRTRKVGGGRKKLVEIEVGLLEKLESLVEASTRGDPESPLRWTCKSTTKLSIELKKLGYNVSQRTVCNLLKEMGYLDFAKSCGLSQQLGQ